MEIVIQTWAVFCAAGRIVQDKSGECCIAAEAKDELRRRFTPRRRKNFAVFLLQRAIC